MVQYVTITCDSPECQNTVTFEGGNEQAQKDAVQEHPWMNGLRFVNMPDNRKLGYCSDSCEIEGIKIGAHNVLEQKIQTGNAANVALAAKASEAARLATQQIKQGGPVTLA
jgi:hypothetical protein